MNCGFNTYEDIGCWFGNFGALIFFFVHFPQLLFNYQRKSTEGFSSTSVFIRNFGLSFHVTNSLIEKLHKPYILTGIILLFLLQIYFIQFTIYRKNKKYLFGLLIPIIPFIINFLFPEIISITNWLNPISQIICYIPYIFSCLKVASTNGISLLGQHINFLGGIFGFLMCSINCNCSQMTWLFYCISLIQSLSIFLLSLSYNEYRLFDKKIIKSNNNNNVIKLNSITH